MRKLPERRTLTQPLLALSTPPKASASEAEPSSGATESRVEVREPSFAADVTTPRTSQTEPRFTSNVTNATEVPAPAAPFDGARQGGSMSFASAVNPTHANAPEKPPPTDSQRAAPPPPPDAPRVAETLAPTDAQRVAPPPLSSRIEPLSAQRYKVQFTGSAELVRKLELARDLMRHCHPGGELWPIVERALDLLIESLMKRRFGKKARPKRTSAGPGSTDPEPRSDVKSDRSTKRAAAEPSTTPAQAPTRHTPTRHTVGLAASTTPDSVMGECAPPESTPPDFAPPDSADVQLDRRGDIERASVSPCIPRSTRRAVLQRDGLGCSWVDDHGVRCRSRAWLEYDHRHPRAKGGGSDPDNVRLLCRSHNRFAAELVYGREHVERTIGERQQDERCT